MMKKTRLWKRTHDWFIFYWNNECNKTIKKGKKLRPMLIKLKNKKNWNFYFYANDCKQKIICKTKILKFYKTIDTNIAKKINCDDWSNEPDLKIMFLMSCWKYSCWLKVCKAALTKNWQHFLKIKHAFWSTSFFGRHVWLTWVIFLIRRIRRWCTVQQSLWKKNRWIHEKTEFK